MTADQAPLSKLLHASGCAVHNMPAYPAGPCDCGAEAVANDLQNIVEYRATIARLTKERDLALERIGVLEGALQPFAVAFDKNAAAATRTPELFPDGERLENFAPLNLCFGDIQKARAALTPSTGTEIG